MSEKRKVSFVFHYEWLELCDYLPPEQRCEFYEAIINKARGKPVEVSDVIYALCRQPFAKIDEEKAKYERVCEMRRENGAKGGAPKNNQNASKQAKTTKCLIFPEKQAKQADNDNDYDSDYDNNLLPTSSQKRESRTNKFVPPSLEEIKDYVEKRGYQIDAEAFYTHYESNGWMVGRNKMKSWQASVANWNRRENEFTSHTTRDRQIKQDSIKERMIGYAETIARIDAENNNSK